MKIFTYFIQFIVLVFLTGSWFLVLALPSSSFDSHNEIAGIVGLTLGLLQMHIGNFLVVNLLPKITSFRKLKITLVYTLGICVTSIVLLIIIGGFDNIIKKYSYISGFCLVILSMYIMNIIGRYRNIEKIYIFGFLLVLLVMILMIIMNSSLIYLI